LVDQAERTVSRNPRFAQVSPENHRCTAANEGHLFRVAKMLPSALRFLAPTQCVASRFLARNLCLKIHQSN